MTTDSTATDIAPKLKVTFRKRRGVKAGRYLIRCDCGCGNSLEIFPPDELGGEVEIGGVSGMAEDWLNVLMKVFDGMIVVTRTSSATITTTSDVPALNWIWSSSTTGGGVNNADV